MKKIGYVFGKLKRTGWGYLPTLASKINKTDNFESIGLYFEGNPQEWADLDIEFGQYPKSFIPRWDTVISEHDVDLIHRDGFPLLNPIPAMLSRVPVVSTAHGSDHLPSKMGDVEQYRLDEADQTRLRLKFDQFVEKSFRYNYDRVLTVSDWVRNALIQNAGFPPEKVITTKEPIADTYLQSKKSNLDDSLPRKYIFHVSYAKQRKNIAPVIKSLRHISSDIHLVIAGKGWENYLSDLVEREEVEDIVRFEGFVDRNRLIQLYDHATCFVLPSLQENFGLPNVEAMARGTPVVTTRRAAIPEVCGDAVKYIQDPTNPASIAEALNDVLTNEELRQHLSSAGKEKSERYQWDRHVENMLELYTAELSSDHTAIDNLRQQEWDAGRT